MLGCEHPHAYTEEWTLEAIGRFVAASGEIRFEAEIRPQLYEWMERVLVEKTLENWVKAHREETLQRFSNCCTPKPRRRVAFSSRKSHLR